MSGESAPRERDNRKPIAILGGGCGALAAAFRLTETEALRKKYKVTVYQQGWRLGGKGATGRNGDSGHRIEEHGIHVWMGFYTHAFSMMQACYDELRQRRVKTPLRHVRDAFEPQFHVAFQERVGEAPQQRWEDWQIKAPRLPGNPWDIQDGGEPFCSLVKRLFDWSQQIFVEHFASFFKSILPEGCSRWQRAKKRRQQQKQRAEGVFSWDDPRVGIALTKASEVFKSLGLEGQEWQPGLATAPRITDGLNAVIQLVSDVQSWLRSLGLLSLSAALRRGRVMLDLAMAALRGLLLDVFFHGFESIDHLDFRDWLRGHGADERSLWSAPLCAVYDMVFAYPHGDSRIERGRVAAGASIRGLLLLLFGYRHAPMWKMKQGMGDAVFAPLYQLLKEREVDFEFFHRVERLEPDGERLIGKIKIKRQAALEPERSHYDPLIDLVVPGEGSKEIVLPCWPAEPLWDQLEHGGALQDSLAQTPMTFESDWIPKGLPGEGEVTLSLEGGDGARRFEAVILGIPVGALGDICEPLRVKQRWRRCLDHAHTVATQSVQIWLTQPFSLLAPRRAGGISAGYERPFDSWADESLTLPYEGWGKDPPSAVSLPKAVQYFCGSLRDPIQSAIDKEDFPVQQFERVKQQALWWLHDHVGHLLPGLAGAGGQGVHWELLVDPKGRSGSARFDAQYWRANINRSERYVLSLPGTLHHRMRPGETGYDNLYVAGDWTHTQLNGGSVEAAVESGLRAAEALIQNDGARSERDRVLPLVSLLS